MGPHSPQLLLRHSLGLVVLKLDVQAVLDAHFHLDGGVELGVGAQGVHNDVHLLDHIVQPAAHSGTEEIPVGTAPSHQGHTGSSRDKGLGGLDWTIQAASLHRST